ncbi:MAG: SDR family oxidoreductase [Bacteroidota bacterium]
MANNDKYALITGATSGIGFELARLFAKDGYNLVIVARSEDELQEVSADLSARYKVAVVPVAKDLFEPDAAQEVYDEVKAKGITVNILVNDAGQGEYGFFAETDIRRDLEIIQLNVISLVHLTKLYVKDMVGRNEGKILNVSSVVGKMPAPLLAVYAGTKAFVYSFTQSVINELKGTNVTMTALLPGATETDFFHKAGMENTKEWKENPLADPVAVAKDGYDALMSGDATVVSGLKNKFMVAMSNITPDSALAENMRQGHMKNVDGTEGKREIPLGTDNELRQAASNPTQPGSTDRLPGDDDNARTSGRGFSAASFEDGGNPAK